MPSTPCCVYTSLLSTCSCSAFMLLPRCHGSHAALCATKFCAVSYQQLLLDWLLKICCSHTAGKLPPSSTACHASISHCLPCWNQSVLAMLESVTACQAGISHCLPCWSQSLLAMLASVTACHAEIWHCLPCWN